MFNKVKEERLREAFEEATMPFNRKRIEACSTLIQEMVMTTLDVLYYDQNDFKPSYETIISTVDIAIDQLKAKRFGLLLRVIGILMFNAKKKLEEGALTYNWLVVESIPDLPHSNRLAFQIVVGINQKPDTAKA